MTDTSPFSSAGTSTMPNNLERLRLLTEALTLRDNDLQVMVERLSVAMEVAGLSTFVWWTKSNLLCWDRAAGELFKSHGSTKVCRQIEEWIPLVRESERDFVLTRFTDCALGRRTTFHILFHLHQGGSEVFMRGRVMDTGTDHARVVGVAGLRDDIVCEQPNCPTRLRSPPPPDMERPE